MTEIDKKITPLYRNPLIYSILTIGLMMSAGQEKVKFIKKTENRIITEMIDEGSVRPPIEEIACAENIIYLNNSTCKQNFPEIKPLQVLKREEAFKSELHDREIKFSRYLNGINR